MSEKLVSVLYEGPCDKIIVAPYGDHDKGVEKEYPENFAIELIETSKTHQFKIIGKSPSPDHDNEAEVKTGETPKTAAKTSASRKRTGK